MGRPLETASGPSLWLNSSFAMKNFVTFVILKFINSKHLGRAWGTRFSQTPILLLTLCLCFALAHSVSNGDKMIIHFFQSLQVLLYDRTQKIKNSYQRNLPYSLLSWNPFQPRLKFQCCAIFESGKKQLFVCFSYHLFH